MKRKVKTKVKGFRTTDGAGVKLVRVLGNLTTKEFDPILMLDSFDSINPDDYTAGFPMHPHRGIETISYVSRGKMVHRDSLGNEAGISDGEVQWMNSGSGIMHEEMVPAAERLLGVQLWLNLPAKDKMSKPSYNSIKNEDIKEIEIEGGKIRLLAGKYGEHEGYKGDYLSMDYYDIHLNADAEVTLTMEEDDSVMVFTLLGDVYIDGEHIEEKTAVKLTEGDSLTIKNGNEKAQVLYMNSRALNEPVAWAGPIVMNTQEELQKAFLELRSNTFIKRNSRVLIRTTRKSIMSRGRMEAFSDGVLAIVITIMVLKLNAPKDLTLDAVKEVFPTFLAYILSFIYVGIYWANHHHLINMTDSVSGRLLWKNLHWIFWMSLIPMATEWMGLNPYKSLPALFYGIILFMCAVSYNIVQAEVIKINGKDSQIFRNIGNDLKGKLSIIAYAAAIILLFIFRSFRI